MTTLATLVGQLLQALLGLAPLWLAALAARRGALADQQTVLLEIKDGQLAAAVDRPADSRTAVGML